MSQPIRFVPICFAGFRLYYVYVSKSNKFTEQDLSNNYWIPKITCFQKDRFFYNDARKIITSRCFVVDPPRHRHAPGQPPRVAKSLPRCIQVQTDKAIFLGPHKFFRCRFLHHLVTDMIGKCINAVVFVAGV